ncbi:MAG: low-specificity L-threonine aldolase [Anaerolineaceae bacterium 4572_5.1]|nr:MAG: low-specificity L-threonine aldolase [Anaerolineaceae bacterium 4572_5.1]
MKIIDLRSDTVTKPTPEMREAMATAKVGDDVYKEDPTVNRLEEMSAALLGKEAGLFLPSGTMGNLAAILAHCGRGDEIILGNLAHTFLFEAGGIAALGGVHPHTIPNQPNGTLRLEDIKNAIRPDDVHFPTTRLITLENTHNRCGGTPLTAEYTQQVGDLAKKKGLKLHLDGARIFNASAALGVEPAQLSAPADSVTFCLSKGLAAPVGSVLCGSVGFIARARRMRKQLGGGMRQAGIIASAGIVALETVLPRLGEDHVRAKLLAQRLSKIPQLKLEPGTPATNMVYCTLRENVLPDASQVAEKLREYGVLVGATAKRRFRLVTHYWVEDADLENIGKAFEAVFASNII